MGRTERMAGVRHFWNSAPGRCLALVLVALLSSGIGSAATQSHFIADGFDFPVGKPDADSYYKARGFYPNGHLGEDWNGKGGGNTDLGDPIYSIAHGVVVYSEDYKQGWGNVVIIRHAYREKNGQINFIDSLYGHLLKRMVRKGDRVRRGEQIGTMGRGPYNMYLCHLHFEIRKNLSVGMNRSKFKRDYSVYHSPTHFIRANRRLRQESRRVKIPVNTFLKSNPNQLITEKVSAPDPGEFGRFRGPQVSPSVDQIIKKETNPEAAKPESSKKFLRRVLEFLRLKKKDR